MTKMSEIDSVGWDIYALARSSSLEADMSPAILFVYWIFTISNEFLIPLPYPTVVNVVKTK